FSLFSPTVDVKTLESGDNSIYINPDADGVHADVWINSLTPGVGTATEQLSMTLASSFAIAGGAANDLLTIDFSTGNMMPAGGASFDGGGGDNTLAVIGTSGDDTLMNGSAGASFTSSLLGAAIPLALSNVQTLQMPGGSGGNDIIDIAAGSYNVDGDTL